MRIRRYFQAPGLLALLILMSGCFRVLNTPPAAKGPAAKSPAQASEQRGGGVSVSGDYILGAEDILEVLVWRNEGLSRTVLIRPDGKISLPLIGDLQAAGLTTTQLRDSIKKHLEDYKETPEVSIIVREINSLSVFVTGEVVHPGKLQLRSDTTLLQALSLAGGFTKFADVDNILLLRREKGRETRMQISYKKIVSGKNPGGDILLQRGDTIVVP